MLENKPGGAAATEVHHLSGMFCCFLSPLALQGYTLLLKILHKSFMGFNFLLIFFCLSLKLHTSKYITDRSCDLFCGQKAKVLRAPVCAPNHALD